jgi:hypothetical protein
MLIYPNVSPAQIQAAIQKLAAGPFPFSEPQPNCFLLHTPLGTVKATYAPDTQVLRVDANAVIRGRADAEIKAALGRA